MEIDANPILLRCTPESLYKSIITAARYGIEIGGPLAQAYIVPFKDKAQLVIGYRGLIAMVMRTGTVQQVAAEVVREGDKFERTMGIGGRISHVASKLANRDELPITHVYCQYLLANGNLVEHVMTKNEIDRHATLYSKALAKQDSPWHTSWTQMALKTVLRQPILRGIVPVTLTDQDRKAFESDEAVELAVDVEPAATITLPATAETIGRIETHTVQPDGEIVTTVEDASGQLDEDDIAAIREREAIQSE